MSLNERWRRAGPERDGSRTRLPTTTIADRLCLSAYARIVQEVLP